MTDTNRPNIIYIMADDMGYGDLGCYGATKIPTPNMNNVAANGIKFTDAHSSSAVCTPSRYSTLTGRYCWRTWLKYGVTSSFGIPLIEPERETVASMLKKQGYATFAVGKWHLGLRWKKGDGSDYVKQEKDFKQDCFIPWSFDGCDIDYSRGFSGGPIELGFDRFWGIAGSLDMPPYCFVEDSHTVGIPDREKTPYEAQQRPGLMVETGKMTNAM